MHIPYFDLPRFQAPEPGAGDRGGPARAGPVQQPGGLVCADLQPRGRRHQHHVRGHQRGPALSGRSDFVRLTLRKQYLKYSRGKIFLFPEAENVGESSPFPLSPYGFHSPSS